MKNLLVIVLVSVLSIGYADKGQAGKSFRRNPVLPFAIGVDSVGKNRFDGTIADLQLSFGDKVFHRGPAQTGDQLAVRPTAEDVKAPMRFTCRFTTKDAQKSQRLLDNVHPGGGDGTLIDIYLGRLRIDLGGGVPGYWHPTRIPTGREVTVGVEITREGELFLSVNGDRQAASCQVGKPVGGFNIPPYEFRADEDGSKDGVLSWKFPMGESCHEGLAFSDGITGVLAFGAGSTLNLTVGRADLWDHRGGYHWADAQSYTNITDALVKGDMARLWGLFDKKTPRGEPRNPYMLPLGRVVLDLPGAELKSGKLDTRTGLGTIDFLHNGQMKRAELAMSKSTHTFAIKLPEGVAYTARPVPAMDQPAVKRALTPLGFKRPEVTDAGFTWQLPADESVTLACAKRGAEVSISTARGAAKPAPAAPFVQVRDGSVAHWRAFWARSARVKVPDPVIQGLFDYGMYRFGGMTDPDGVPCGLQGPWLEDNYIAPWSGDYHFNINVQECYSPAYRGGHAAHLMPLFRMVLSWRETLRENARKFVGIDGYVLPHSVSDRGVNIGGFWSGTIDHGSAAWVAQMMFDYVKYSGDMDFLRRDAYDFMKGAMAVYRKMMVDAGDKLAIPIGPSPEFGCSAGRNPSFQLAAAHRLARNLIAAARLLGEKPDPMWLEVERRLPLAMIDDARGGIMLYENRPFPSSHRHHSHLAGFYPFDIFDPTDAAMAATMRTSFNHWRQIGVSEWTGWCIPWASVLCTHMGEAESAAGLLRAFEEYFTNPGHSPRCYPWKDGFVLMGRPRIGRDGRPMGQEILDMDGLLSSATAIMEMMVHEVNGKEFFFRGCPESWKDVSFENIALADGRRVSGRRLNGKVELKYSGSPTVSVAQLSGGAIIPRAPLRNAPAKFAATGKGTVAFLGGSITEGNFYRPRVAADLQARFPGTQFNFIAAGLSSTCSTCGAFRFSEDILSKGIPDVLFVEFAVNDDQNDHFTLEVCRRGMEGVIRQARRANPKMDIVMILFTNKRELGLVAAGKTPVPYAAHLAVAEHYGVPTVNIAQALVNATAVGTFNWNRYGADCHPNAAGSKFGADRIADLLDAEGWGTTMATPADYPMPEKLDAGCYDTAHWVAPGRCVLGPGFNYSIPDWRKLTACRANYSKQPIIWSTTPGSTFTLKFKGAAFGALVLAGSDAGRLEVSIDGDAYTTHDLYDVQYSRMLQLPYARVFREGLADAEHTATCRVAASHHAQSCGTGVRFFRVGVNGKDDYYEK